MYQKVGITSVENKREKRRKKLTTRSTGNGLSGSDLIAVSEVNHPHSGSSYGSVEWLHSSSGEEKHSKEYLNSLRAASPSSFESKDTNERSLISHLVDHGYTSEAVDADSDIQASESDALLGTGKGTSTDRKRNDDDDSLPVLTAVGLAAEEEEGLFQASKMRFVVAILLAVSSAFNSYIQMTFVAIW
jgi:hypothetical protein